MSTEAKFSEGQAVYLLSGRECVYVGAAGQQHVVYPVYDTDEGVTYGKSTIVDTVFAQPPTEKLHADVAALELKADELRSQVIDVQSQLREAERTKKERLDALTRFDALKRIEDFIAGRITHCVITREYKRTVKIVTLQEALADEDRRHGGDMKLLSLFGRSNGDLVWRANRYYDGSGSWIECAPFCSLEEATEFAKKSCLAIIEEVRAKPNHYGFEDIIRTCEEFGVEFPAEMRKQWDESRLRGASERVDKARADLTKAEDDLRALREAA